MIENIKNLIYGKKVNLAEVDGETEITKIEYLKDAEKLPNSAINLYDLLGYELQSDTVEFYFGKKFLGRGYIADIAGVTVDITRIVPEPPKWYDAPVLLPEEPEPTEGTIIKGESVPGAKKPLWTRGPSKTIPCVILEGAPRVEIVRFEYLREIEDAIIDDERNQRYTLDRNTRIEIKMPDGKTGPGYICDPTGKTIRIIRSVKTKIQVKKIVDGKEVSEEVLTSIKFSGGIGKLSAGDRLPKLLSGMPGRENLLQIGIGFFAGLLLGALLL
jgi:hypothetical protein